MKNRFFLLLTLATLHQGAFAVDFAKEIHPILKQNCLACHNTTKAKADLILENREAMLKGGETGPAIVPGNAEASLLFTTSAHTEEPYMPPKKNKSKARKLNPAELVLLKKWINEGAIGGTVFTEAPKSWKPLIGKDLPIYALAASPDSRYAVIAKGSRILVYDVLMQETASALTDPALKGAIAHSDAVQSIAVKADLEIASGGYRVVKRWTASVPAPVTFTQALPAGSDVIALSPDKKTIALGATDGTIRLYQIDKPTTNAVSIKDHTGKINGLAFTADGKSLVSASTDKSLRLRTLAVPTKSKKLDLPFPPNDVTIAGAAQVILIAGTDNNIHRRGLVDFDKPAGPTPAPPAPAAKTKPAAKPAPAKTPAPAKPATPKPAPAKPVPTKAAPKPVAPKPAPAKPVPTKPAPPKPVPAKKAAPVAPAFPPPFKGAHTKPVTHLLLVPGQKEQFLSASTDGFIVLWNLADGKQIRRINHGAAVAHISVSLDGALLATSSGKGNTSIWKLADGKKVKDIGKTDALLAQRTHVGLRRETAKKLHTAATASVAVLDKKVTTEKAAATKAAEKVVTTRAAYEKALADFQISASVQKKAGLAFEILDKKNPLRPAAEKKTKDAKTSYDKTKEAFEKGQREWQVAARNQTHSAHIAGLAVEEHTAALQQQKGAELKQAQFQKAVDDLTAAIGKATTEFAVENLAFSADGKVLFLAMANGEIRQHHTVAGEFLESTPNTGTKDMILLSGDNFIGVNATNQLQKLSFARSWTLSSKIGDGEVPDQLPDRVTALAWSPDGLFLATGCGVPSRSGELKLWNVADGTLFAENKEAHRDTITSLQFSQSGDRLASAASDKLIRIWDPGTLERVGNLEGHTGHVHSITWNSDGLTLASGSADTSVKIWTIAASSEKQKITTYEKEVTAVAYQQWSDTLVTGSGDNAVKIANAPLPGVTGFVHTVAISPDGKHVVAGDADGKFYHWDIKTKKLVKEIQE